MYAKSAKAMQDRYYKEVQQIIQTANKEIQVYQDKLAALDEADRAAQEARTQRQNKAALRDLNESYAKQEAENAKEMAAAEKEYEEQRASLQAMIDKPTSRTARIIAERDLAALEERWRLEREGLEQDHAEKLLEIQRQLDEEKLTQQEDAEAAERDKEREHLNDLISDRQNSAQQLLTELNNRYTVEAEVQQKALAEQLENAKESYRKQLDAAKTYYDNLRDAALQKAKDRRDALVEQERLTSAALAEISGKQLMN